MFLGLPDPHPIRWSEVWMRGSRSASGSVPKCHGSATLLPNAADFLVLMVFLLLQTSLLLLPSKMFLLSLLLSILLSRVLLLHYWLPADSPAVACVPDFANPAVANAPSIAGGPAVAGFPVTTDFPTVSGILATALVHVPVLQGNLCTRDNQFLL